MQKILKNFLMVLLSFSTVESFASATKKTAKSTTVKTKTPAKPDTKKKAAEIVKVVIPQEMYNFPDYDCKIVLDWIDKQKPQGKAFILRPDMDLNIIQYAFDPSFFNELMKRNINVTVGFKDILNTLFNQLEDNKAKIERLKNKAIEQGMEPKEIDTIIEEIKERIATDYDLLPLIQKNNQTFFEAWLEANTRVEKELVLRYLIEAIDPALKKLSNKNHRVKLLTKVNEWIQFLKSENRISEYSAEMLLHKIEQLGKKYGIATPTYIYTNNPPE